jgi:hypothetical protein
MALRRHAVRLRGKMAWLAVAEEQESIPTINERLASAR